MPIAMCTTLNVGLNNISLTMVSLFVNQVIKACAPALAAFFSFVVSGKTFSHAVLACVGALVLGSILANAHSMAAGGSETALLGVLLCSLSLVANALKPVVMSKVMTESSERPKLAPTVVLFYDSAISFGFMLFYWLLSPERAASLAYLEDPHKVARPD